MYGNGGSVGLGPKTHALATPDPSQAHGGQGGPPSRVAVSMALYPGADASQPGAPLPPSTHILAAYVGQPGQGAPDTPHVWTAREWNSYVHVDPALRLLPIYVHNYPDSTPGQDADNAVRAVEALGWVPQFSGGLRQVIALDLEVLVAYNWVFDLEAEIEARGFVALPYGSRSYVVQNPSCFGYWIAQLTSRQPTVLPQGARGIQWRWGSSWDYDVFDADTYSRCAVGPRKG